MNFDAPSVGTLDLPIKTEGTLDLPIKTEGTLDLSVKTEIFVDPEDLSCIKAEEQENKEAVVKIELSKSQQNANIKNEIESDEDNLEDNLAKSAIGAGKKNDRAEKYEDSEFEEIEYENNDPTNDGVDDDDEVNVDDVSDSDKKYLSDTDSYSGKEGGLDLNADNVEKAYDLKQHYEAMFATGQPKGVRIKYGRKTKKQKEVVCGRCKKAFTTEKRLEMHINVVHGDDSDTEGIEEKWKKCICQYCSKRFTSASRLKLHLVTHTGEKPFSCDFCDQKFSHPTNKRRHMKIHTGDKPYECLFCGKAFPVKHHLKDHLVKHTGEKPHKCSLCDMAFAHRFSLKQHQLLKHPGGDPEVTDSYEQRPFTCEVCDKKFTQLSSLKIHERLHSGSKPYQCPDCDQSFIRRDSLVRHQFEHSGDRPYRCDLCEKGFTSGYILKQHRSVHTGDKKQQCEVCGVELANKESLARHMMKHLGQAPFQCEQCPRKFTYQASLTRHLSAHAENKTYECKECDKTFPQEKSLTMHKIKHTNKPTMQCEYCGTKFTYPTNLDKHMKAHERGEGCGRKKEKKSKDNANSAEGITESEKVKRKASENDSPKKRKKYKNVYESNADKLDIVDADEINEPPSGGPKEPSITDLLKLFGKADDVATSSLVVNPKPRLLNTDMNQIREIVHEAVKEVIDTNKSKEILANTVETFPVNQNFQKAHSDMENSPNKFDNSLHDNKNNISKGIDMTSTADFSTDQKLIPRLEHPKENNAYENSYEKHFDYKSYGPAQFPSSSSSIANLPPFPYGTDSKMREASRYSSSNTAGDVGNVTDYNDAAKTLYEEYYKHVTSMEQGSTQQFPQGSSQQYPQGSSQQYSQVAAQQFSQGPSQQFPQGSSHFVKELMTKYFQEGKDGTRDDVANDHL